MIFLGSLKQWYFLNKGEVIPPAKARGESFNPAANPSTQG